MAWNKFTHEDFLNKFYKDVWNNDYEVISKYSRMVDLVTLRHKTCGYEFTRTASKTTPKVYCPKCYKQHRGKRTHKQFVEEVQELTKGEYKVTGKYINVDSKVEITHTGCGESWEVVANSFLSGTRCPKCAKGGVPITQKEFEERLTKLEDYPDYRFLEPYKNYDTKIKIQHKVCGTVYMVSPNKFFTGRRCPRCRESHGEARISQILDKRGITYEREKTFEDLRDVYPLRYDFYVMKEGTEPFLVEFDGRGHFEPIKWNSQMTEEEALKELQNIQRRDRLKDNYAKVKNIRLYRVKYNEDIEETIQAILEKERSTTIER